MKKKIIGRTREYTRLDKCMREDIAQLVLVYGRRRVGKTFLINQYFGNTFAFKLTGAYNKPKTDQLEAFINELNRKTHRKMPAPKNWTEAFELLREYIESLDPEKKCVVFLMRCRGLTHIDPDSFLHLNIFGMILALQNIMACR